MSSGQEQNKNPFSKLVYFCGLHTFPSIKSDFFLTIFPLLFSTLVLLKLITVFLLCRLDLSHPISRKVRACATEDSAPFKELN